MTAGSGCSVSTASDGFARGLGRMLVQILLYGGDPLFALCALAQHLRNFSRPASAARPQGLDNFHHPQFFRGQPDPAARATLGIETQGRAFA